MRQQFGVHSQHHFTQKYTIIQGKNEYFHLSYLINQ